MDGRKRHEDPANPQACYTTDPPRLDLVCILLNDNNSVCSTHLVLSTVQTHVVDLERVVARRQRRHQPPKEIVKAHWLRYVMQKPVESLQSRKPVLKVTWRHIT